MAQQSRLFWIGTALVTFSIGGIAQAQDAAVRPANTQLPQQVLPTGAEDAPQAASAAGARSAASATLDQAQLERDLVRMTSESDAGLTAVKQADGSTRVNLDGRFMSVLVATPTSAGSEEISCHEGQEALEKVKQSQAIIAGKLPKPARSAAATPKPAPAPLEEK